MLLPGRHKTSADETTAVDRTVKAAIPK